MVKESHIYEFGPFRVDPAKRLLSRGGELVQITPKCFDILVALIESSGEAVSKNQLIERVWPDSFVEEGNLTYNISVLRKALGERAGEHQYIVTVPGRGYQFVASVMAVRPECSEESVREEPAHGEALESTKEAGVLNRAGAGATKLNERANKSIFRMKPLLFVFGAAALATVALFSVKEILPDRRNKPMKTVAVLPLTNSTGDPEMEYLSDGISESLINSLSQLQGVKVIARASSFKYKGSDVVPQEAALALGADAIFSGRLALVGDNLVISTELINAHQNTQMWGERYNRKAADLLSVQSEISTQIVRNLRLKLTTPEEKQLAKRETLNPQAYQMLLAGRFHREKLGTENLKRAVEDFKRAIAIDPGYAGAYAELCVMYTLLSSRGILDPKEYLPQAEAAARRALELDENLAEAHFALANLEITTWKWAAAAGDFERALELNPGLARARFRHAAYLSVMRRHDEAVAEIERALELDPLSVRFKVSLGLVLFLAHRYDEAMEVLRGTLKLDQSSGEAQAYLGHTYAAKGMYPEAIAAYREAIKLGDDHGLSTQIHLGAAYARAGQRAKSQAILKQLQTSKDYVSPGLLPILYVALDEREQAFASLERAYASRDPQLQYLGLYPGFDAIRSDPRFQDLMRQVGLPQ